MRRPFTSVSLALTVALAPVVVHAGPPEDDPLAEARDLYEAGQNCFDLADYPCAIDKWTSAYSKTPNEPEHVQIRVALLNNLATAREKTYDLTGEVIHLKQARELLTRFKDNIGGLEMSPEEQTDQVARIDERLDAIEQELLAQEAETETEAEPTDRVPEGPVTEGPPEDVIEGPAPDPHAGRPLIITGGIMLGLGAVAGGFSFAFMAVGTELNDLDGTFSVEQRETREAQGEQANNVAIITGVGGILLVGAGATLLGIGLKKNKQGARSNVAVLPYASTEGSGVSITGRF